MARTPRAEVIIDGKDQTGKSFQSATNKLRAFGQNAKRLAATAALAIIGISAAVIKVGTDLFKLGSDAAETQSKFDAVFMGSAQTVQDFADDFRQMAGVTKSEAQAVLATAGAIAQGLGFAEEASAGLATEVIALAGDLGSFNNIPTEETARAISSALTGERESLKRLGIVIKQVDVDQLALTQSGKESVAQLNDQDRATATLALITEKAGAAIGDLARTQTSSANRAKQLSAQFRQLKEDLAVGLLPVLSAALPIIQKLADRLGTLVPKVVEFINVLADIRGVQNIAIKTELDAIEAQNFTVEQLESRRARTRQELTRITERLAELEQDESGVSVIGKLTKASRDRRAEIEELQEELVTLGGVEEGLFGIIDKRTRQDQQAAAATRDRTAATREAREEAQLGALPTPGVVPIGGDLQARGPGGLPLPMALPELPENLERTSQALLMFQIGFAEATSVLGDFEGAAEGINETLGRLVGTTLVLFQAGFVEAFEAIGAGDKVFASLGKAIKRSLADAATAEAKVEVARGVAKLAAGLFPFNPAALASSAQHFAAAALFGAAAGAIGGTRGAAPGGGVGGRGPISSQSIQEVQLAGGLPTATVNITGGGAFNMNDPQMADEFAQAITDLTGRNIIVNVGG